MFNNQRFMTSSISDTLGVELQAILWGLIDERIQKDHQFDYLQVFELDIEEVNGQKGQRVRHRQEVPTYSSTHYFRMIEEPVGKITVWAIDDGEQSTMLFPEEY